MAKSKPKKKHRTSHYADPDDESKIIVFCESCEWRDFVDVRGLSWVDGMTAIYAARDAHEAAA